MTVEGVDDDSDLCHCERGLFVVVVVEKEGAVCGEGKGWTGRVFILCGKRPGDILVPEE